MPAYLNGQKVKGAYLNGHKVNGFINGVKVFSDTVTIHCSLFDVETGKIYKNIDLTVHPQDGYKPLYDLNLPQNIQADKSGWMVTLHISKGTYNNAIGQPYYDGENIDVAVYAK